MFSSLSKRLGNTFDKLRGRGRLTDAEVDAAAREIRIALLEADVALPVVQDFIATIKDKAVGQDVTKGVNPGQQVVKIVHDALVDMLGGGGEDEGEGEDNAPLTFGSAPCVYLMVGLQGSGKTTTTAKIARHLKDKHGKRVLMASLDVYRPAARQQLAQLGAQTTIDTLEIVDKESPLDITSRALRQAKDGNYDVVILDTAGRTTVDDQMMDEVAAISDAAEPTETLLVADAMTGQDAVTTAKAFADIVNVSGIILTRVDGDARGGAALSMRAVTGKPIKLLGVGERWDAIEPFHAKRIAGRILGMGDVVSLVEKAAETVDADEAARMMAKMQKGKFDFNDLLSQMRQMKKMGGMSVMMKMLPGMGNMMEKAAAAGVDDNTMKRQEAVILSMTKAERARPEILNMSRKRRIAAGCGLQVADVNKLAKQLKQVQATMKHLRKSGLGKLMGKMMGGGSMEDMAAMMGGKGDVPSVDDSDILSQNPFSKGAGGLGSGLSSGLLASPAKKKRKPRPKRTKKR